MDKAGFLLFRLQRRTKILRRLCRQMRKGVTDIFGGDQVAACVAAYSAGADLILALKQTVEVIDAITAKVESGEFPMEELDAKVYRVLRLKQSLGLLQ